MVPGTAAGEALYTAPEGGLLALPPDLVTDEATIAAPAAATLDFDHSSFTVVTGDSFTVVTDGEAVTPRTGTPAGRAGTPTGDRAGDVEQGAGRADENSGGDDQAPTTRRERRQAASAAESAQDTTDTTTVKAVPAASGLGAKVVTVAFRYAGVPYLWGGTTPRGFDCSGFTKYVYAQLGVDLGRTVAAQRGDVRFVSRSQAKPGDLVFFGNSHMGIYLGDGYMIDAPRRGKQVQKRKIYSSSVSYGRVVA